MIGLAIADTARRGRRRGHGTPTPTPTPAPISAVAADGWQATMVTPADLAFAPVTLTRQGFDAAGTPASHAETLHTTKRVRQPYPNHAVLTAAAVALSDYVYATDTIAGVTNASAETSPKPVAAWSMADRRVVGHALTVGCVAFHRNARAGKPVACVRFIATDGVNAPVTATVSSQTATVDTLTGNRILEYVATLDITSLNDATTITVNAEVYPWIGDAASVRKSVDLASQWQFSPRSFRKNVARAASPPIVRVKAGGNDATGVVSTNPATADAAPCATIAGAINRAADASQLGTAAGALDGLRIQCDAGTWTRPTAPTARTVNAAVVIEPIPGVARASCVFQFGAANNGFNLAHVHLKGLTIQRTGAFYLNHILGTTTIEDCAWDWNGNTGQLGNSQQGAHCWINTSFGNVAAIGLSNTNGVVHALFRGCVGGLANGNSLVEMITYIGNAMTGLRSDSSASRPQDNVVIAFNRFIASSSSTVGTVNIQVGTSATGIAVVQNLFEYTAAGGTAQRNFMPSSDGGTTAIRHLIFWHNTQTGFDAYGRGNILYDDSSGTTRRNHALQSFVGNIHVQINTKSDIYAGGQGIADAPNRTGNWAYGHGVGVRGEFVRYRNASGNMTSGFHQDYPGMGSVLGTTNVGAGIDPLFTDYRGTAAGPVAGAGGGTYTIGGASPARGLVTDAPLPVDLAGSARGGTAAAGAYA